MLDNICLLPTLALVVIVLLFSVVKHLSSGSNQSPSTHGDSLPYRLRDDFLSAAELSLYHLVAASAPDDIRVMAKVNLGDLFFVHEGSFGSRLGWRNRIDRKHVDLLLCDERTLRPRLGIELDDRSHATEDRRERDDFVDRAFRAAGLPLLRIPAQVSYNAQELRASIERAVEAPSALGHGHTTLDAAVRTAAPVMSTDAPDNEPPLCPRCGVPMVRRTARRGTHAGETFWGCPNYPHCRGTRAFDDVSAKEWQ